MAVTTTYAPLPDAEHSSQLRKAVIASTIAIAIFIAGCAVVSAAAAAFMPDSTGKDISAEYDGE